MLRKLSHFHPRMKHVKCSDYSVPIHLYNLNYAMAHALAWMRMKVSRELNGKQEISPKLVFYPCQSHAVASIISGKHLDYACFVRAL